MAEYLITGGTGFIGAALCRRLAADGGTLTVLSRDRERALRLLPPGSRVIAALAELEPTARFDAVINLAGEPIADARWSAARKRALESSRIGLTTELVDWMLAARHRPVVLVSGSAIGFYGDQGDTEVTEESPPHDEYQHRLCRDWEAAAQRAASRGIRTVVLRTGLVVAQGGGFLARMLLPFRLGLGGPVAHGRQWMSWIHRDDMLGIIQFLLAKDTLDGVFNATAPNPVNSRDFARTLGRVLHRPAVLPVPGPVLRLALGEMSRLLLTGQRVLPRRLLDAGYRFRFETLEPALREAVGE